MINIKNMRNMDYHKPQLAYYTKQIDEGANLDDPLIPLATGALALAAGREGTPFTEKEWDRLCMGYNPFKDDWFNHPLNGNPQKLDENHEPIVEPPLTREEIEAGVKKKERVPMTELIPTFDKSISIFFAAQSKVVQDEMLRELNRIVQQELYPMIRQFAMYEKDNKKYYAEDLSFITSFAHIENRAVEPFLHFHICVANSVVGHDGKLHALENKGLHDNVSLMDAAFHMHLANYLKKRFNAQLVVSDTKPDKKNQHLDASQKNVQSFAIAGVPKEAIALYSKRSAEIEKELEKQGTKGHKAAEIAQASTRAQKTELSSTELRNQWNKELREKFGYDQERAQELAMHPGTDTPKRLAQTDIELVKGFHRRTGEAFGTQAQIKAHLFKQLLLHYSPDVVESKAAKIFEEHFLAATTPETKELYEGLETSTNPEERMALQHKLAASAKYVSRYYLDNELKTFNEYKAREETKGFVIPRTTVLKGLKSYQERMSKTNKKAFKFNAGQLNAAISMLSEPGAVMCIKGKAGAGKTSVVKAAKEIAESQGYRMIGTATQGKANNILMAESGIKDGANTAALLMQLKGKDGKPPKLKLTNKDIVLLDEAGMTSAQELWEISAFIHAAGAKLVMLGDGDQIQAVGASNLFRHFTKNFTCVELNEIQRQSEAWQCEMVSNASQGKSMDSILALYEKKRVAITKTTEERVKLIAKDYLDDPTSESNKFIVASLNEDADTINNEVQRQRIERGELKPTLGVAVVEDEDGITRQFHVGERVVFSRTTDSDDPTNRWRANNADVGRVLQIEHSPRTGRLRAITIELDNGKPLTLGAEKAKSLKLGSCLTTHKSQGDTVKNSYLFASNMLNNLHSFYVQVSRHKENTKLYLSEDQVERIARDRKLVKPSPAQQSWARDLIARDLADQVIDEARAKRLHEITETFQGCREYLNSHREAWTADSQSSRQKLMEVKTLAQFVQIFEAMGKANYKKSTFDISVLSAPVQEKLKDFMHALTSKSRAKTRLPVVKSVVIRAPEIKTIDAERSQSRKIDLTELSPLGKAATKIKRKDFVQTM